jgi:hypothetical protein
LATEPNDYLPLFIVGLQVHHAGGGMVRHPEGEPAVGVGLRFVPFVEGNRCLPGLAEPADDPQFATRDHGLIDQDVGRRRSNAAEKDGSG